MSKEIQPHTNYYIHTIPCAKQYTYHTFCEAVDRGKEVRAVFCDISKAFDRVWHRGLLHKLSGIGCSDEALQWFSSYLTGRKQHIVVGGQASEWDPVEAGVPQGSILRPLLFLIYINDIVRNIGASIRLFANDTSLYIVMDSPLSSAAIINSRLKYDSQLGRQNILYDIIEEN